MALSSRALWCFIERQKRICWRWCSMEEIKYYCIQASEWNTPVILRAGHFYVLLRGRRGFVEEDVLWRTSMIIVFNQVNGILQWHLQGRPLLCLIARQKRFYWGGIDDGIQESEWNTPMTLKRQTTLVCYGEAEDDLLNGGNYSAVHHLKRMFFEMYLGKLIKVKKAIKLYVIFLTIFFTFLF